MLKWEVEGGTVWGFDRELASSPLYAVRQTDDDEYAASCEYGHVNKTVRIHTGSLIECLQAAERHAEGKE